MILKRYFDLFSIILLITLEVIIERICNGFTDVGTESLSKEVYGHVKQWNKWTYKNKRDN